jgi:serine/threonine protein phosphatase PrpC
MNDIKLLGKDIKTEKKGYAASKYAEISYVVRRMHDVCGDSALIYTDKNKTILAVLDGVSGEEGAEQASSIATIAILNFLKNNDSIKKDDLHDALVNAHSHIVYGFTTVLVVVVKPDGSFLSASVGDSTIYSLSKSGKLNLEMDLMRMVGVGSPVFRFALFRNNVTSVLGLQADLEIFFKEGSLDSGDSLLLVTDGILDNLKFEIENEKVKSCSGIKDLSNIIDKEKNIKKITTKIRKEILKRMDDRIEIKEETESLIIKPDDFAIIGLQFIGKKKTNKSKSTKKKHPKSKSSKKKS